MTTSTTDSRLPIDAVKPDEPTLVRRRPSKSFDTHPFTWLNQWIMYFPMWTADTVKNNKMVPRNAYVAKYGYYAVILFNIIFCGWDVFWWIYRPGLSLYSLVFFVSIALTTVSRAICIYYFFNHFQYFGLSPAHLHKPAIDIMIELPAAVGLQESASSLAHDQHNKLMRKTNIRFTIILIYIILAAIFDAIMSAIQTSKNLPDDNAALKYMMIWQIIFNFVYIYFYHIPLFLVQFVLSIYYVRACIFVKEFTEMIDINHGDIDFSAAIEEYSSYRTMFKDKIVWLEKVMLFRLTSQIFWIWVDINWIIETPQWYQAFTPLLWLIISILPFLEMVMSGNAATKKFHALHKKLYRIGTERNYFSALSLEQGINRTGYLFLLEYIRSYPFMIRILAREVSFKNAARVSAAFIIAKAVAYLFKMNVI